ncbi:MAG: M20/M25/M40 family metallo-hydrolase [Kosmotogaceae bacterium]|nr:M20/M25/M40 family metallo-hydrolase [Kosmotogaceae bacterium]
MNLARLLVDLSNAFGPVGYESEVHSVIREAIGPFVDEIYTDEIGNLIAVKKGTKKRIAVFTHVDEVSLVISKIDERGFARFEELGGIDPKVLISQKVKIKCRDGKERAGVIGMLAPHLQKKESRGEVPSFDELFIDASINRDFEKIDVGDLAVVDFSAFEMNGKVSGKALDDRACAAISIETARELSKYSLTPTVHFVFTTREEVGAIGAKGAAEVLEIDLGVAMDVTHHDKESDIELGKGPALTVGGPNIHKKYFELLDNYAKDNEIKVQYEFGAGRTGTDADNVQIAGTGIPTLLLSLPEMHMHTPVEVVQISDIAGTARLLAGFFVSLEGDEEI